jgi:hypothetical protein
MQRLVLSAVAALILILGNATAQTSEKQEKPVTAKDPTVVTVYGKRGEVDVDKAAQPGEKKPNVLKRMATKVGQGVGTAWHGVVDATRWGFGVDDDHVTDPKKDREQRK